jgi:hypothetical protein
MILVHENVVYAIPLCTKLATETTYSVKGPFFSQDPAGCKIAMNPAIEINDIKFIGGKLFFIYNEEIIFLRLESQDKVEELCEAGKTREFFIEPSGRTKQLGLTLQWKEFFNLKEVLLDSSPPLMPFLFLFFFFFLSMFRLLQLNKLGISKK